MDQIENKKSPNRIDTLKSELKHKNQIIRQKAAKALGKLGDTRAVEPLITALTDKENNVRATVIEALEDIGTVRALEPLIITLEDYFNILIGRLKDKNYEVRCRAAKAFGKLGDTRAVEPLITGALMKDKNSHVRKAAANALDELGWKPTDDTSRSVYWAAQQDWKQCVLLGTVAVESILIALTDKDSGVRLVAANALNDLGWKPKNDTNQIIYWIAKQDWKQCVLFGTLAMKPIIITLRDKNSHVRCAAANVLKEIGDIHAVMPLITALRDKDNDVRMAAAIALDQLGWKPTDNNNRAVYWIAKQKWEECVLLGTSAVKPIIAVLEDRSYYVRKEAASALDKLGWKPTDDSSRAVLDIPTTVKPVMTALKEKDIDVQNISDNALKEQANTRAVDLLMTLLKEELNDDINVQIARVNDALKELGDIRAAKPLIDLLNELNEQLDEQMYYMDSLNVQIAAADVLEKLGDAQALKPLLITAFKDKNSNVQKLAIELLGKLGDIRAVEPLIVLFIENYYFVKRETIAKALGKLCDSRAVIPLIIALKNIEDINFFWSVAWALGKIGDTRAMEPLVNVLQSNNEELSQVAAQALGNLGDVRAVEPLVIALKSGNSMAARALGILGDERAIEPLIATLANDKHSGVKRAAIEALGQLASPQVMKTLVDVLYDENNSSMRRVVAKTIGKLMNQVEAEEKPRILIVDDSRVIRKTAKFLLHKSGFCVSVAEDGIEAFKQIWHIQPDLIFLDTMMPRMDGFEFCERLKNEFDSDIPVIFLTSQCSYGCRLRAYHVGAVHYMTLPFTREELTSACKTYLAITGKYEREALPIVQKEAR